MYSNSDFTKTRTEDKKQLSIIWRNVQCVTSGPSTCGLGCRRTPRPILHRLNGFFEYGTLNGLMGPSGAGKTTLLNCLSGQRAKSQLTKESEIYMRKYSNAKSEEEHKSTKMITHFIEQHVQDSISASLTVEEIFQYSFRFKNKSHHSVQFVRQYIGQIVHQLMLDEKVLDRKFQNCSGGEQKRVAIGQELMCHDSKPAILFVDEPTTGLDSASAVEVTNCLKQLIAHYQMTIVASIHVPSDEVLGLFGKLYVLAKGGLCIYSGAPHQIEATIAEIVPELAVAESAQQQHELPIEMLMKIACNGIEDSSVAKLAQHCLANEFEQVSAEMANFEAAQQLYQPHSERKRFSIVDFYLQSCRLCRINFVANYRAQLAFIGLYVFYFAILGTMFNSSMSTASGCLPLEEKEETCGAVLENEILYKENLNFLSYALMYFGLVVICGNAVMFSSSVKMFRNWYSLGVFYWSSVIVNILELFFYGLFMSTLTYFISGQHGADQYTINWHRFMLYTLFMCLLCLYAQSSGQLIGVIFVDNQNFAIIFSLIYYIFATMINGFFVDTEATKFAAIKLSSDMVALKFVSFGITYSIYGYDRCDHDTEFSFVLQFYHVKVDQLYNYIVNILIYIVVVRVLTLAYISFQYQHFSSAKVIKLADVLTRKINMITIADSEDVSTKDKAQIDHTLSISPDEQHDGISQFKSITLGWTRLSLYETSSIYEFDLPNKSVKRQARKLILNNLNGHFCRGTLNAIMGTSGAGKTTLLRVLNGQLKSQLSEQTHFHVSRNHKIITCFIAQEVSDHLWTGLTVKQQILYASKLKNLDLSNEEHEKIVTDLLNEFNLLHTLHTKVENCSGGERKRLALAQELTSLLMPNLICIDEPTSGLDSNSSEIVVSCLRRLTRHHSLTIIVSIHQPNTKLLLMFDQLYVLARGGVCVFSGPPSRLQEHMNKTFDNRHTNNVELKVALEQLIKHSCAGTQDEAVQKLSQQQIAQYETDELSDMTRTTLSAPDGVVTNRRRFSGNSCYILCLRYIAYIRSHLWKEWLFYFANYLYYGYILIWFYDLKMIDVTGCIDITKNDLNSTCIRSEDNIDETNLLLNNTKYSFFMVSFYLAYILIQTSLTLRRELVYFRNEHRNNWYTSGSFYLMKVLFETLFLIVLNLIYVFIVNYYEPIRPGIYWELFFFFTLTALAMHGLAHICTILCANYSVASLIFLSITLYVFTTLLGNFFLLHSRLHYFYQFLSNFSIIKYCYEAIMLLEYGFGRCKPKEIQAILYIMELVDQDIFRCIEWLMLSLILYRIVAVYLLVRMVNPIENRRRRANRIVDYRALMIQNTSAQPDLGSVTHDFSIKMFAAQE